VVIINYSYSAANDGYSFCDHYNVCVCIGLCSYRLYIHVNVIVINEYVDLRGQVRRGVFSKMRNILKIRSSVVLVK